VYLLKGIRSYSFTSELNVTVFPDAIKVVIIGTGDPENSVNPEIKRPIKFHYSKQECTQTVVGGG
jgi:hypothetical protein